MRIERSVLYMRRTTAFAVLVLGIALSSVAALLVAGQLERAAGLRFERAVSDATNDITTRINDYADVLLGARGLFAAKGAISRVEFARYVQNLDLGNRFPGIRVIHYSPRITAARRPAFEAMVRGDTSIDPRGYPDFVIYPAGDRPEYVAVTYIDPITGNERVLGLDLGGDPARRATLERARDSGRIMATGPIALALDPDRYPGFSMRLAIYRSDAPIATEAQRREAFSGLVSASFIALDLMRGVLNPATLEKLHVRIHDAGFVDNARGPTPAADANLMFDSNRLHGRAPEAHDVWAAATSRLRSVSGLEVGGRRWNLFFSAPQGFGEPLDPWMPWFVLLIGTTISTLLFGLTRSLATSGQRALALAARMTGDLRHSEEALRATNQQLQMLFQSSPLAIYTRDASGLLTSWNPAAEKMYGWKASEVLGKPLPTVPGEERAESDGLRKRLLAGEPFIKYETRRVRRDGSPIEIDASLGPLRDAAGNVAGIIAVVEDITPRKQMERRQAMEHNVTRLLAEFGSQDEVMPKLLQTIGEALHCACGARRVWDEREQKITCAETWSVPLEEIEAFIALNRDPRSLPTAPGGLLRRVLADGEPVWIPDVTQDPTFRRASLAAQAGLRGAFAFPIRFGNQVLGVMEFFSRENWRPDELLIQATRSIGNQIGQFIARWQAEERVRHLAHIDDLTGLSNRSMFNQRLSHALARVRRIDEPLAVLFIDLDRFKNINDTLGHAAGDRALKEIAQRLRECLRETDTVSRLGGDEFVVLIEGAARPADIVEVAQKILTAVARPVLLESTEFHLTASIGISTCPGDSTDLQGLMKNADIAMYRAKEQGKNNFQFYSDQINVHTLERVALESGLRHALERDEFLLHYQPKVDIVTRRIVGMEALVRWQEPGRGLVEPARFIPLAEETGLIVPIGEWVLKTACERNKAWQDQGFPRLRIAVNLSARQFAHESLLRDIARVLAETGLDPAWLELEITESMVMREPERAVTVLRNLKAMGIHLSIDDFGTGYSSLSYLKRFPLDSVKIDRSFVQDIPGDADDAGITRAIIAMAHNLRLAVIAEGVETGEQLEFLRANGCDQMQGYLFSRPVPEEEFLRLLSGAEERRARS